jgi:hypothetical protein
MDKILNAKVYLIGAFVLTLLALVVGGDAINLADIGVSVTLGMVAAGLFVGAAILKTQKGDTN